jgi:hypothetical protein
MTVKDQVYELLKESEQKERPTDRFPLQEKMLNMLNKLKEGLQHEKEGNAI